MKIINIVSVNKQVNPQESISNPHPSSYLFLFQEMKRNERKKELEALDCTDLQD